ncbi:hypothetical protein BOTBODRAFT_561410 [Botryobasidium botryosum FD-172 SS1]|uniref:Uncharacterized protein n=1 Tax=Botryobasidium botryosum (strain FD-172 SS1) TaxID=930990 RepID=A0A067LZ79_BOTB1|nr:hypothetical protein BOTBODRAFT_561410 [Botryobasidium botryosum FD-172 SS1]
MLSGIPAPYLATAPAYILIPSSPELPPSMAADGPSFPLASPASYPRPHPAFTFQAPAHKHAHHLHSIPPREKSTRTLILDHFLWQHCHARFSQARAELGLHHHEANEAADSDSLQGGVEQLGYGLSAYNRRRRGVVGEDALRVRVDLVTASKLRAKAEGLEKVLSAMLDQPPQDASPFYDPTASTPPSLPNGVRLRIALASLLNDLFARPDEEIHGEHDRYDREQLWEEEVRTHAKSKAPSRQPTLAPVFLSLARVSAFGPINTPTSQLNVAGPSSEFAAMAPPPGSIFATIPPGSGPEAPWALSHQSTGGSSSMAHSEASFQMFQNAMTHSSSSMPPMFNDGTGRHFGTPPRVYRAVGRSKELFDMGVDTDALHHQTPRCPRHLASCCPGPCLSSTLSDRERTRTLSSIGAGLSKSSFPLRRLSRRDVHHMSSRARDPARKPRMTELLPHFLRLSALVAVELRREMGEEQGSSDPSTVPASPLRSPFEAPEAARPTREWYALFTGIITRAVLEGYLLKGWKGTTAAEILFGIGLGLHEVEPPNSLGERTQSHNAGSHSRLSSQGRHRGSNSYASPSTTPSTHSDDESDDDSTADEEDFDYISFEPEEMPTLLEAGKILFPHSGLRVTGRMKQARGDPEEEYVKEMEERISEFLNVPVQQSALLAHLEELSSQYPAEPVERAALRYCESIARWRGMPELEMHKAQRMSNRPTSMVSPPAHPHSFDDLRTAPAIESYFSLPQGSPRTVRKRGPSNNWTQNTRTGTKLVKM